MSDYEFMFVVDELRDAQIDQLVDDLEASVATHHDMTLVTVSASAVSAVTAGRSLIHELTSRGVVLHRVYDDLVTRNQIASRAKVTPQTVGNWVRNDRRADAPFPKPHVLGPSLLWRWADVNAWLARTGMEHDDDVAYPTLTDLAEIELVIGRSYASTHNVTLYTMVMRDPHIRVGHVSSGSNAPSPWTARLEASAEDQFLAASWVTDAQAAQTEFEMVG